MLIFFIFFTLCVLLAWFVLAIPAWVSKFGWIKQKIEVLGITIRVRENKLPVILECSDILPEKYIDRTILKSTEIVVPDNLFWGGARLAGMSKDYFSYLRFKTLHVVSINLTYSIEKNFTQETFSRLFVHEYLHRYLDIHDGDSDPYHSNPIWKELGV